MTYQNIIAQIQKYLDDVEGADADSNSVIKALQLATLELSGMPIVKERLFPETSSSLTLVAAQSEYTLPTDYNFNINRAVYDSAATVGTQRDLHQIPLNRLLDYQQDLGASVEYYTLRGNTLITAGIPTSNEAGKIIKLYYSELPDVSLITNDATETLLSKKYPHVLIDMAIVRFLLTEPDLAPVADRYEQKVEKHQEAMRQELETVTALGPYDQDVPPL